MAPFSLPTSSILYLPFCFSLLPSRLMSRIRMDRRLRRGGPWCHQHRLVDEHDSWTRGCWLPLSNNGIAVTVWMAAGSKEQKTHALQKSSPMSAMAWDEMAGRIR
jgi:hypothetical protein